MLKIRKKIPFPYFQHDIDGWRYCRYAPPLMGRESRCFPKYSFPSGHSMCEDIPAGRLFDFLEVTWVFFFSFFYPIISLCFYKLLVTMSMQFRVCNSVNCKVRLWTWPTAAILVAALVLAKCVIWTIVVWSMQTGQMKYLIGYEA